MLMGDNTAEGKKAIGLHEKLKPNTLEPVRAQQKSLGSRYGKPEVTSLDQKLKAIKEYTGYAPQITVSPNESDLAIIGRREEAARQKRFDDYMVEELKLDGDPTTQDTNVGFMKVKEMYPQLLNRRMAWLQEQDDIRRREATLRTFGRNSLEDYMYTYLKKTDQDFGKQVDEAVKGVFGDKDGDQSNLIAGVFKTWDTLQANLLGGLKMKEGPQPAQAQAP